MKNESKQLISLVTAAVFALAPSIAFGQQREVCGTFSGTYANERDVRINGLTGRIINESGEKAAVQAGIQTWIDSASNEREVDTYCAGTCGVGYDGYEAQPTGSTAFTLNPRPNAPDSCGPEYSETQFVRSNRHGHRETCETRGLATVTERLAEIVADFEAGFDTTCINGLRKMPLPAITGSRGCIRVRESVGSFARRSYYNRGAAILRWRNCACEPEMILRGSAVKQYTCFRRAPSPSPSPSSTPGAGN